MERERAERRLWQYGSSTRSECLVEPVPPERQLRMIRIGRRNEQGCRQPELLENRPRDFGKVSVGIIEGNQDRSLGKRDIASDRVQHFGHADTTVMPGYVIHLAGKRLRRCADVGTVQRIFAVCFSDSMVGENAKHLTRWDVVYRKLVVDIRGMSAMNALSCLGRIVVKSSEGPPTRREFHSE